MKARLQNIMIAAYDQEKEADFYCQVFGMQVAWRRPPDADGRPRGIFLTDGHTSLGIHKAGMFGSTFRPEGLHSIGFLVDDMEEVEALAAEHGALHLKGQKSHAYQEDKFSERSLRDPIGVSINLTERGYGTLVPDDVTKLARRADPWELAGNPKPRIQHCTIAAYDQERAAEFYSSVLGMHVVYRRGFGEQADDNPHEGGIYMADGHINFVIHKSCIVRGALRPEGLNHFGFVVDDMDQVFERAEKAGALRLHRKNAPYSDGSVTDPIGLSVDVSVRGYGVDVPEDVYVNPYARPN